MYSDPLADNQEKSWVILQITRRDIEYTFIAPALERLMVMTDSVEKVRLYRASLMFQVSGYDHDPRELPEIPEVRTYFRALTQQWPHWLWFLARGTGCLTLLLSILCDVEIVRLGNGQSGSRFVDPNAPQATLADLFERGNVLLDSYDISEAEAEESANSVADELSAYFAMSR